jgi:hypothetical protein
VEGRNLSTTTQDDGAATLLQTISHMVVIVAGIVAFVSYASTAHAETLVGSSPEPLTPAEGAWVRGSSVSLHWSTIADADYYELRYTKATTCTDEALAAGTQISLGADTSYVTDGLSDGEWCWQVRAVWQSSASNWSSASSLKVDTVAPAVVITQTNHAPDFAGTTDTPDVTFTAVIDGVTRTDALFTEASTPDSTGNYIWRLTLSSIDEGNHILVIHGVDQAGNSVDTQSTTFVATRVDMQQATLPLVENTQLVFVPPAPPGPLPTSRNHFTTSPRGVQAPVQSVASVHQVASKTAVTPDVTETPLQASEQGWVFLGIAWYWWVVGGAGACIAWWRLKHIPLGQRLISSLNLSRTVY